MGLFEFLFGWLKPKPKKPKPFRGDRQNDGNMAAGDKLGYAMRDGRYKNLQKPRTKK